MSKSKVVSGISKEQRAHLMNRIDNVYRSTDLLPVPAEVIRARKVVAAFGVRERAHREDHERKWRARVNFAREAVNFKSPEEALDAVKKIEAEAAKHRREKPECHC